MVDSPLDHHLGPTGFTYLLLFSPAKSLIIFKITRFELLVSEATTLSHHKPKIQLFWNFKNGKNSLWVLQVVLHREYLNRAICIVQVRSFIFKRWNGGWPGNGAMTYNIKAQLLPIYLPTYASGSQVKQGCTGRSSLCDLLNYSTKINSNAQGILQIRLTKQSLTKLFYASMRPEPFLIDQRQDLMVRKI